MLGQGGGMPVSLQSSAHGAVIRDGSENRVFLCVGRVRLTEDQMHGWGLEAG